MKFSSRDGNLWEFANRKSVLVSYFLRCRRAFPYQSINNNEIQFHSILIAPSLERYSGAPEIVHELQLRNDLSRLTHPTDESIFVPRSDPQLISRSRLLWRYVLHSSAHPPREEFPRIRTTILIAEPSRWCSVIVIEWARWNPSPIFSSRRVVACISRPDTRRMSDTVST